MKYGRVRLLVKSFQFPLSEVEQNENAAYIARMKELIHHPPKR
jgi:hypothetical protein